MKTLKQLQNMNTHECYVSLELAKLLKEVGFDWESHFICEQQQDKWQQSAFIEVPNPYYDKSIPFSSPTNIVVLPHVTLDVAQRWLREVKGIHIYVKPNKASANCKYFVTVIISETKWGNVHDENKKTILFNPYEEAQEAGEKKALKIILKKEK